MDLQLEEDTRSSSGEVVLVGSGIVPVSVPPEAAPSADTVARKKSKMTKELERTLKDSEHLIAKIPAKRVIKSTALTAYKPGVEPHSLLEAREQRRQMRKMNDQAGIPRPGFILSDSQQLPPDDIDRAFENINRFGDCDLVVDSDEDSADRRLLEEAEHDYYMNTHYPEYDKVDHQASSTIMMHPTKVIDNKLVVNFDTIPHNFNLSESSFLYTIDQDTEQFQPIDDKDDVVTQNGLLAQLIPYTRAICHLEQEYHRLNWQAVFGDMTGFAKFRDNIYNKFRATLKNEEMFREQITQLNEKVAIYDLSYAFGKTFSKMTPSTSHEWLQKIDEMCKQVETIDSKFALLSQASVTSDFMRNDIIKLIGRYKDLAANDLTLEKRIDSIETDTAACLNDLAEKFKLLETTFASQSSHDSRTANSPRTSLDQSSFTDIESLSSNNTNTNLKDISDFLTKLTGRVNKMQGYLNTDKDTLTAQRTALDKHTAEIAELRAALASYQKDHKILQEGITAAFYLIFGHLNISLPLNYHGGIIVQRMTAIDTEQSDQKDEMKELKLRIQTLERDMERQNPPSSPQVGQQSFGAISTAHTGGYSPFIVHNYNNLPNSNRSTPSQTSSPSNTQNMSFDGSTHFKACGILYEMPPPHADPLFARSMDETKPITIYNDRYLSDQNIQDKTRAKYDMSERRHKIRLDAGLYFDPDNFYNFSVVLSTALTEFQLSTLLHGQDYIVWNSALTDGERAYIADVHRSRLYFIFLVVQILVGRCKTTKGSTYSRILNNYVASTGESANGLVAIQLLKDEIYGSGHGSKAQAFKLMNEFKQDLGNNRRLSDRDYFDIKKSQWDVIKGFSLTTEDFGRIMFLDNMSSEHSTVYSTLLQNPVIPTMESMFQSMETNTQGNLQAYRLRKPGLSLMNIVTASEAQKAASAMLTIGTEQRAAPKLKFVNHSRNGTPTPDHHNFSNVSNIDPCPYHLMLNRRFDQYGVTHTDGYCWIPRAAKQKKLSIPNYIKQFNADELRRDEQREKPRYRSRSRSRSNPKSDYRSFRSNSSTSTGNDSRDHRDNSRSHENDSRDNRGKSSFKRDRDNSNTDNTRAPSHANAHSASLNGPRTGGSTH